uniref:Uncharacterized protein n=1 Tax=Amphimedon queenslandica TaxID=400682 RepID=A0A1X7SYD0_AMPQE
MTVEFEQCELQYSVHWVFSLSLKSIIFRVTAGHIIPLCQWSIYLLDDTTLRFLESIHTSKNILNDTEDYKEEPKPSYRV